ncbi:MAG TPA: type II toxin-antitoxin system VapC family toxin [Sphingomicrobium sp.]|nr:type II toxin-antitoxin system VapC family toxin [Sphingomicrobium sp.]
MTRLVDTSVAVKWLAAERDSDAARALIGEPLVAPDLMLAELSNAVWKKWRRGQMVIEQVKLAQPFVASFVELVPTTSFAEEALRIAIELEHPVYDCFYLAASAALELKLVTADSRLIDRCAATPFADCVEAL